jgi:asparagine synthase (glutamine-hydrolysing)
MCGIAGLHSLSLSEDERTRWAEKAHLAMKHRGPDGFGVWSNQEGAVLVHRRLAILDLSPAGHQPMISQDGRWVVSFNGEMYNHVDVRQRHLSEFKFKGSSDTETLLAAVQKFGPLEAVKMFRGMFALIIWDRQEKVYYLFRDRLGEKPLYYGFSGTTFMAASELKVFLADKRFDRNLNYEALQNFLTYNYVPQAQTIFSNVKKLLPGHCLRFDPRWPESTQLTSYWKVPVTTNEGKLDFWQAKSQVKSKLQEVVKMQMISDVPLGAFLSGGIDSSLITALMQAGSTQKVRTYSIGFEDAGLNEAPYAKKVASHLGTEHTEWILSAKEARDVIPRLSEIYDEPFADSSQIPTTLLSQMTRRHVTVSLSGDGGDELFGGYNRYYWTQRLWGIMRLLPRPTRQVVACSLRSLSPQTWNFILGTIKVNNIGEKIHKASYYFQSQTAKDLYHRALQHIPLNAPILSTPLLASGLTANSQDLSLEAYMMWHDQTHYLPDDILVKVDRAAMSASLESRAPFLDHELVELVAALPLKIRFSSEPKKFLKSILYDFVPKDLVDRPKMGFGIPLESWLQKDLNPWLRDLLSPETISRQGIFNPQYIERALNDFTKRGTNPYLLWNMAIFQDWHKKWLG